MLIRVSTGLRVLSRISLGRVGAQLAPGNSMDP